MASVLTAFIDRLRRIRWREEKVCPALEEGIDAKPWMVKPNRAELEAVFGTGLDDPAERLSIARRLYDGGIAVVALTLGMDGALLVSEQGSRSAVPPTIEFASAVAS